MLKNKILLILVAIMILSIGSNANALREPRSLTIDGRLKTLNYHPQEVYKFTGYFYFQTIFEFEKGEVLNTISVGNPQAWQISTEGNRMFIKPIGLTEREHVTNMTIISNKRRYFFELYATESKEGVVDQNIPFLVSFVYPTQHDGGLLEQFSSQSKIDFNDMSKYNLNYTVTGSSVIEPIEVFDDGKFTYFKFKQNAPIPAILEVTNEGYEGIVNYRIEGEYLVVEDMYSQYTLRYGSEIACVFDENNPLVIIEIEEKGWLDTFFD